MKKIQFVCDGAGCTNTSEPVALESTSSAIAPYPKGWHYVYIANSARGDFLVCPDCFKRMQIVLDKAT